MATGDRRPLLLSLDIALAAALALAAMAIIAGGLHLDLGAVRISIRSVTRPLLIAAVIAAVRLWLGRSRSAAASAPPHPAPPAAHRAPGNALTAITSPLRVPLLALVFTAIGWWILFLTTVCGGSDSYGYVSASRLLPGGPLVQPQEIAAWLPVPNALDVSTPAGYVPSGDRSGIAPQYPLGLPALMALVAIAAGPDGPYAAAPLAGAALLVFTALVGAAWAGAAGGLLAAALVAWNPLVMTYAIQPMSDVPAAMWFMAAVWCVVRSPRAPLWAGMLAGLSFVTRPGGIGAIAVLAMIATAAPGDRSRSLARFALGLAPFVALQAGLQWFLFGSPFSTGYGSLSTLYAGHSAVENLGVYARGFLAVHPAWWFAALAAAAFAPRREPLWSGVAALALCGAPYIFYFKFDHWETLRFLLPAVVLLSIAAAAGIVRAAHWVPGRFASAGVVIVAAAAGAFAVRSAGFLEREGVPRLMERESRYPAAADRVSRLTPPSSIVLAAQHSGSLRHYANRVTLRWDLMRPEDLTPVIAALNARGLPAFVVLEGDEQPRFRARFAADLKTISMLPVAQVQDVQIWELGHQSAPAARGSGPRAARYTVGVTIVVAGGSGFLGRALVGQLAAAGQRVLTLTRRPRPGQANDVAWTPDGSAGPWAKSLDGTDAVVNLAGEGIADRRWTAAHKARLRDSRLQAVRSLAAAIEACRTPPRLVVGGSAVGYYGPRGDEPVTEETPPGADFLAGVCVEWERETRSLASGSTRVALIRTGLALHAHGGALQKMLLPFKLGVGGRLGSGRQFMPWIHQQDWIRLVAWILDRADASGPFNLTAPLPVTNAEFTRALARALHRPAFLPAPAFALRIVLGEMADALLLTGQRVLPARAEQMGFEFRFRELDRALADLL